MDEKPVQRTSLTNDIEVRLTTWLDSLDDANKKTFVFTSLAVSIVLIVLASLEFLGFPEWVYVAVGVPAGLIVSVVIYYFVEYSKHLLTKYKTETAYRKRIRHVIIGWAVLVPVLIFSTNYTPKGLGGTIMIVSFIATLLIVRRTDKEFYYFTNGLVDPREIEE